MFEPVMSENDIFHSHNWARDVLGARRSQVEILVCRETETHLEAQFGGSAEEERGKKKPAKLRNESFSRNCILNNFIQTGTSMGVCADKYFGGMPANVFEFLFITKF